MYGGGAASAAIFRDYLLEGALYVLIFIYFPLLNWQHLCSFSTCLTEHFGLFLARPLIEKLCPTIVGTSS